MIALYHFFHTHKIIFYSILTITGILFVFLGSKVEYEEDISKLLPSTINNGSEGLVFENLKVKDKIFLLFIPQDDSIDAGILAEKCDEFVTGLLASDKNNQDIQNILYRVDEELIQDGIEFLFQNLPIFIDTSHYQQIETLLAKEMIDLQMATNYEIIVSPEGAAYRNMIRRDPIGLRSLFTNNTSSVSEMFGGNYKMLYGHFFTPDTTIALAFLSPQFKSFDSKSGIRLVETIEASIASFKTENPDIEILFHGAPVQSVFNSRQIKKDLAFTLGLAILIICLIIGLCFKNNSTLFMLLGPVVYGTFFALSCIYLIKGKMSLMALGIGAIVLGVALSYCLHILTHYKYVNDPLQVLKDQKKPIFLGCLTTIGAFLGLLFTQSALLQDFGLFASFGLTGTTAFSLVFLPHFFRPENNKRSDKAFRWLEKINSFPLDKQKWLIIIISTICFICFYFSHRISFDSNLRNIGYHEPDVLRSTELLAEKTLRGNASVFYAATSLDLDSALFYNNQMVNMLDSMAEYGIIKSYSKAATLLPLQSEQEIRIRRWQAFWTPDRIKDLHAKLVASGETYRFKPETFNPFFEVLDKEYKSTSIYQKQIIPDEMMSNIIEYTDNTFMVFTSVQMLPENKDIVSKVIALHPHWVVVDPFFYTNDMVRVMNDDFNTVLGVSSVFVFIVLLIAYRNIIRAILAFIPMGLSWYVVLGIMVFSGLSFNLINIVISTFIFGIGVDYSIFIMDGLIAKSRGNYSNLLMYHKTAIFFSAIVLIIGVGSLILATHPAMKSVGITTMIGMSSTVLITFTIQPFLFNLLSGKKNKK